MPVDSALVCMLVLDSPKSLPNSHFLGSTKSVLSNRFNSDLLCRLSLTILVTFEVVANFVQSAGVALLQLCVKSFFDNEKVKSLHGVLTSLECNDLNLELNLSLHCSNHTLGV